MILPFLLALATVPDDAAIDRMVRQAPRAVRSFIARRDSCDHWAGEEAYDKDRGREIAHALRAGRCDRIERDETLLRRRLAGKPALLRLLDITADRE